jgi:acetoacetyl-CoA synthetase
MTHAETEPLWTPSADVLQSSPMACFRMAAEGASGRDLPDYWALHRWSVEEPGAFWSLVWDFCGVIGDKGEPLVVDTDRMPGARFFPDASLNFAENLLRRSGPADALVFQGEDGIRRRLSWDELAGLVSRLQQALLGLGVGPGDRVAAMMPNVPETIAAFLATASIGAVWSSCSPDFGPRGVLDRFGQIEPVVFFAADGYVYGGKTIGLAGKLAEIVPGLPTLRATIIVPCLGDAAGVADGLSAVTLDAALAPYEPAPLRYSRLPFAHPLAILFSSGTTGVPKCIVHSAGGTLLQHLKEHQLHCGIVPEERVFYFTTCGWMMWNWLVSTLASEATLLLYDGSPFHPSGNVLFDYAEVERAAVFGTSAKFIDSVSKAGLRPAETHDLGSVRLIASTGSPLSAESFDFVYSAIRPGVHLASISGGTDIVSCFVLGIPLLPVWRGEIQGPGLGMAVDVWDEAGQPIRGEKGELVCTRPFPSMPVGFWNDADGAKYRAAYFERFPGVWCHGDFAEWTSHGGIIIHGRSDATLNPGGVRIGTAEIYGQVEQIPEVIEALAIGQEWDNDVRIVLFVRLREGAALDEALETRIRIRVRSGASPRHVPARIVVVPDIPRTKSGKIVELAVREMVHGRPVRNREALANPEALEYFADLPQLRQ